jgi:murein DD-endopeptidase MepM/ murein hydrolase activator NlpD
MNVTSGPIAPNEHAVCSHRGISRLKFCLPARRLLDTRIAYECAAMSCVFELLRSRFWPRAATLALIAIGLAGCSGGSLRFNESPFAARGPEATGALRPEQVDPVGRVDSQPPPSTQKAGPPAPLAPKYARVAAMSPVGNPGVHVVAQGETLTKISRLYGKPVSQIAKANRIQPAAKLNMGDRLVIPGARLSAAMPAATPAPAQGNQAKPGPVGEQKAPEIAVVFSPVPAGAAKAIEATGGLPKFRWPAKGRVIAGFGLTTNGQKNDGINIALPENTSVKAAEDGVVEYAGTELTAYGNLVQVRHPDGYVTAYAHAKELLVKRGDQVKRGQPIARSGQTGNVNAPQLHFQVRKGATPLDPMNFLIGA